MMSKEPAPAVAPGPADNPIRQAIADAIAAHEVILFMKGTPEAPACGFSARTVAILQSLEVSFAAVDILPDPRIRQELSAISNWPTIPQLFSRGELIGGCDIVTEMYESGELAEALGLETGEREDAMVQPIASEPQPAGFTPIENRLG
jgi:monothiol glutaredoxin